ncbi:RNA polymerase sigma factor [Longimicrobium sp.]|uniref:RNA polymerase sigma factor n=1 Tax=Longimicrobium sp. TaxID=2029185 RepID=UPI002C0DD14B|nr:RNA polymerase sigma factor [Longimicrobium sp.]HSU16150.1 RNA polymerase sigma factor [Longimicrobium sp.]
MARQSPVSAPVPDEAPAPRAPSRDLSFQAAREEQLLVQALRERDEAAFELVLDRYYAPMLRTATIYVGSRARAEEVVQETWLAVLGGIDRFGSRSSLKTWIFRILINRAKTSATRDARLVPLSSLGRGQEDADGGGTPYPADPLDGCPPDAEPLFSGSASMARNPEDWLLSDELREHIEAAIGALPAKQREVIVLRDVEGWTPGEVCNMLEISESNQRVLLHRARVRVRDALAPYLVNP